MKKTTAYINGKKFNLDIAITDEEQASGLQNIESLKDNEGMIFVFDEPQEVGFWMKDTLIPLKIIFISEDEEIISVADGVPNDEDLIECDNVKYVIEVNSDIEVSIGDEVEIDLDDADDDNIDDTTEESIKAIINPDGTIQKEIDGNEKVFSIPHTKRLIKLAKIAFESKSDDDYKRLGNQVFKYMKIHKEQDDEYISIEED